MLPLVRLIQRPLKARSFHFACFGSIDLSSYFPTSRAIQVVTFLFNPGSSIDTFGPFSYAPVNIVETNGADMTKVTLPDMMTPTGALYFNISSGIDTSQILIDNVVIETRNTCPPA
jgi:hypothetical protein